MKVGEKFRGHITKNEEVLFADHEFEIFDKGEYQTLGSPGYWFQLTLEEPVGLSRGDSCELRINDDRYQIEVSQNINSGSLTFLIFNIRKHWADGKWTNLAG